MYQLVDRATGEELGTITDTDLKALMGTLVSESEEDADFFVTADAVELLAAKGLSPESLGILRDALTTRGDRDIGWEPLFQDSTRRITTVLKGSDGKPLPGLRGELRADLDDAEEIAWAFSRGDGSLTIGLDLTELAAVRDTPLLLTVLALGDSPLVDVEIEPMTAEDRNLEDVDLPLMSGRLVGTDGVPISAALVEVLLVDDSCALDFTTWTTTGRDGEFTFAFPPVDSKDPAKSRLELEIVAASGEPLEFVNLTGILRNPQLGEQRIPPPNPEWQPSEEAQALLAAQTDSLYPGVGQQPLS